jgi:hypothetical protein
VVAWTNQPLKAKSYATRDFVSSFGIWRRISPPLAVESDPRRIALDSSLTSGT